MITKEYPNLKCDVSALHEQLVAAGFAIDGVSYDEGNNLTTVYLNDAEEKNPDSVVAAYVYVAPPPPPDFSALFAQAATTDDKVNVIARLLGLIK